MENQLYYYKAKVTAVYDGDTITVDIDLGLKTFIVGERIRLIRINAPELTGKDKAKGVKSRDFLREKILGKEVFLQTIKDKKEKYGRYLAEIFIIDVDGESKNINDLVVANGFAKYQTY